MAIDVFDESTPILVPLTRTNALLDPIVALQREVVPIGGVIALGPLVAIARPFQQAGTAGTFSTALCSQGVSRTVALARGKVMSVYSVGQLWPRAKEAEQ